MALGIPSIIWKLLVNDTPTLDDLEAVDLSVKQSIENLRHIEQTGIDEESFAYTIFNTFETISSDQRTVELVPGGKDKEVTFANRHEFCDLVINVSGRESESNINIQHPMTEWFVPSLLLLCRLLYAVPPP